MSIENQDNLEFSGDYKCRLVVSNAIGTRNVAFKVKTTQPNNYVVKPNQGILNGAGAKDMVEISLVKKYVTGEHKFLVQAVAITDDSIQSFE